MVFTVSFGSRYSKLVFSPKIWYHTYMMKAIIYDFDDTMVNTCSLHIESWYRLLRDYNLNYDRVSEDMRARSMGMRIREVAAEVIQFFELNTDIESFYQKRLATFIHLLHERGELLPGLMESLQLFTSHHLPLGIGSSGTKSYIDVILRKFNLVHYFDVIVTADDVTKGKPDPEVYLKTAKRLGVHPRDCLVLEDATKGIQAAKAAGCYCIAIENPYIHKQDLSQADRIVPSLRAITPKMINTLSNQRETVTEYGS
jgi:beta-phosphoglucomutase-like phosphatase (HAD superfamily)